MSDSSIWGTLTRADAGVDITLRHVYRTSVADLWSAVTEPDRLARWLGRVTGDLHEQGSYTLVFEEDDDSQRASGVVLRCDAPRELVVTWAFPGEPDAGTVRVGLEAVDGGTELTLTHRGLADRLAAGYGAGWQAHLEGLESHVDGPDGAPLPWDADRFDHLLTTYTALAARP